MWSEINLVNLRENIAPTRGRAHLVLEKGADHASGACGSASSNRLGPPARHAAQPEPRELGDPGRELVAVDFGVGVAERPPPDRLRHADDRVREHLPLPFRRGDLDQRRDRLGGGVEDLLDDARELGIGSQRRAEQEAERRAVADRELEVGAEADLDPFAQRARAFGRLGERASSWRPVSSSSST